MTSEWQPLPSSSHKEDSPFLAKYTFDLDRYVVHITDLSHVWSESLDRRAIIQRAHDIRCSVDPDDGATQLAKLLEKIKAALQGGEDTELTVDDGASNGDLTILSVSPLPKPLRPLRWSMYLTRLSDTSMKTHVILPLIGSSYMQSQQIEELVILLREKDNALGKIMDKIESIGLDLSNVFPQAGAARFSKKKSQREHIFKQVRGLAPFDRAAWNAESRPELQSMPSFGNIAKIAFAASVSAAVRAFAQSTIFSGSRSSEQATDPFYLAQRSRDVQERTSQPDSQQDGFQHQATPPELRQTDIFHGKETNKDADVEKMCEVKKEIVDDDTTEDEEETVEPGAKTSAAAFVEDAGKPSSPMPLDRSNLMFRTGPSPRKLGLIGSSKHVERSAELEPVKVREDSRDNEETSAEWQPSSHRGLGKEAPEQAPRKLGKIGGHKTKLADEVVSTSTNEGAASDSIAAQSTSATNEPIALLREVESSRKTPGQPEAVQQEEAKQSEESNPAAEESPQAKADRKRSELKREMEEKSRVAPTKTKKRRF